MMKAYILKGIFILSICFMVTIAWCQDKSFTAKVSRDTVLEGNTLKVDFVIKNTSGDFEPPKFEHFDILSGPNTSTSMQIINGQTTSSSTYTYILKPKKKGKLFIENAYLLQGKNSDENLETKPIAIIVKPNPEGIIEQDDASDQWDVFSFPQGFGSDLDVFKNYDESRRQRSAPAPEEAPAKPKRKIKRI